MDTRLGDVTYRDVSVSEVDTPTILKNATDQAVKRRYEDFCMVDVDSHHYETDSFADILKYIEDPVMRHQAQFQGVGRGGISGPRGNYQEMAGRVGRLTARRNDKIEPDTKRDIALTRRWMDALGVDITCLFPTPMLALGLAPQVSCRGGAGARL